MRGGFLKQIILASKSPRRAMLLSNLGLPYIVEQANVDEKNTNSDKPYELVMQLSYIKAYEVAKRQNKDCLVIGADTIVHINNKILGKPRCVEEAFDMLMILSGKWHEVYTGIAIIDYCAEQNTFNFMNDYQCSRVKFRKLNDDIINKYISSGEPMDKAGAYGIQELGSLLVEKIEGCYFNIVGLPVSKLFEMMLKLGHDIFDMTKLIEQN